MNNPQPHVTSLEISKKLFELDVPQESVWGLHWVLNEYSYIDGKESFNTMMLTHDVIGKNSDTKYKAFLASEIMEMLPDRIIIPQGEPFNCFRFNLSRSIVVEDNMQPVQTFLVNYYCDTFEVNKLGALQAGRQLLSHNIWDKTLPDTLGKLFICLKENKLDALPYIPERIGEKND